MRLATPAADVWGSLLDVQRVASWLSIVRDVKEQEPLRHYTAMLEDRVGPFALRADLGVEVAADAAERRLHVAAAGEDRQVASRISATLDVSVAEREDGTVLAVSGRYEITGKMATLGAGAIRKKGEKVLDEFFANAARDLGGVSPERPPRARASGPG